MEQVRALIARAGQLASVMQHGTVTCAHLALVCLSQSEVLRALVALDVRVPQLRATLHRILEGMPRERPPDGVPKPSENLRAVIELITSAAQKHAERIGPLQLLAAVARRGEPEVARALADHGFDVDMIGRSERRVQRAATTWLVDLFGRAAAGGFDHLVEDSAHENVLAAALLRQTTLGALLVGPPRAGKSCLVRTLARRAVHAPPDDAFSRLHPIGIDLSLYIAGMRLQHGGDDRLPRLLDEIAATSKPPLVPVIVVDPIPLTATPGTTGAEVTATVLGLLRRHAENGTIRLVLVCRDDETGRLEALDRVLMDRLEMVRIPPADRERAFKVCHAGVRALEQRHDVRIESEAIDAAVAVGMRMRRPALPGSAIEAIDRACSRALVEGRSRVGVSQVREAAAEVFGIPARVLRSDPAERYRTALDSIRDRIFGQDQVIDMLADRIAMAESGLDGGDRPRGAFLFAGPSGTGKTETAKALADALGIPLHRIDMSEFVEEHSVARLIGAPPGYVGYSEHRARLVDIVVESPRCVVLFDEIEKAHARVLDLLLQILDAGRVTASDGREGDWRETWVICTSNLGAEKAEREFGFIATGDVLAEAVQEEIRRRLRPELRNRFDAIIPFRRLTPDVVRRIAERRIDQIREELLERNVTLNVRQEVLDLLVQQGYEPALGARPMNRAVDRLIRAPLAEILLTADGSPCTIVIERDGPRTRAVRACDQLPAGGLESEGEI